MGGPGGELPEEAMMGHPVPAYGAPASRHGKWPPPGQSSNAGSGPPPPPSSNTPLRGWPRARQSRSGNASTNKSTALSCTPGAQRGARVYEGAPAGPNGGPWWRHRNQPGTPTGAGAYAGAGHSAGGAPPGGPPPSKLPAERLRLTPRRCAGAGKPSPSLPVKAFRKGIIPAL